MQPKSGVLLGGFAETTRILTPSGERRIDALSQGDQVMTVDSGAQVIRWIGLLPPTAAREDLVVLAEEALDVATPCRETIVHPDQPVLLTGNDVSEYFDVEGVLVPARALLSLPSVSILPLAQAPSLFGIMCDSTEIVLVDGSPMTSLNPQDFRALHFNRIPESGRYQEPVPPRVEPNSEEIDRLVQQRVFVANILQDHVPRPPMHDPQRGWLH